jgi:hypothetical protein
MNRLGVTPEAVAAMPEISALLKQANGGLKSVLQSMRFSRDANVMDFLARYDSIPERDRASLPWEAIALSASIDPAAFLGAAILAIQSTSANAVKVIALSHHPAIMARQVEFAKKMSGDKDRTQINTILGALPTAKGSTFIINPVSRKGSDDDNGNSQNLDYLFPNLSHTQETLVPTRARMLESGE